MGKRKAADRAAEQPAKKRKSDRSQMGKKNSPNMPSNQADGGLDKQNEQKETDAAAQAEKDSKALVWMTEWSTALLQQSQC